ncbi:MAG: PrgI family protein, partial [Candidatus Paceibacterota bacterium]
MRFEVPQFIDVEDKIFGPFTLKQFIYLAGAAGFIAILYTFLPLFWALLLGLPVVALSAALAFYKVNDLPFVKVLESAFSYITKKRLYLWKKREIQPQTRRQQEEIPTRAPYVPKLSDSKLKDLAWSLDIKES